MLVQIKLGYLPPIAVGVGRGKFYPEILLGLLGEAFLGFGLRPGAAGDHIGPARSVARNTDLILFRPIDRILSASGECY